MFQQLFQGRRKGFDVEKALSAESVRDFEKAISMVSYGFDTIEDFYSNSSTRKLVGNLKVPVLFVQVCSPLPLQFSGWSTWSLSHNLYGATYTRMLVLR